DRLGLRCGLGRVPGAVVLGNSPRAATGRRSATDRYDVHRRGCLLVRDGLHAVTSLLVEGGADAAGQLDQADGGDHDQPVHGQGKQVRVGWVFAVAGNYGGHVEIADVGGDAGDHGGAADAGDGE